MKFLYLLAALPALCAATPANLAARVDDCSISFEGKCYHYTKTTTSASCPTYHCPKLPGICPEIIKITSITVPCSTSCCPTTSTYITTATACPTCPTGCVIPTQTRTVTTGCRSTATPPAITPY